MDKSSSYGKQAKIDIHDSTQPSLFNPLPAGC